MNCKDCEHWQAKEESLGLGKCERVKLLWDCVDYDENYDRVIVGGHENDLAFAQDGSDYRASLLTKPEFGCVQFEEAK